MTEIQEEVLEKLFPGYEKVKRMLKSYNDFELNTALEDIFEIGDIDTAVIKSVQWNIIRTLIEPIIGEDFLYDEEGIVMDYCYSVMFMERNNNNDSYEINKQRVISMCEEMIKESGKDSYKINRDVDFGAIIATLNKYYQLKFIEV